MIFVAVMGGVVSRGHDHLCSHCRQAVSVCPPVRVAASINLHGDQETKKLTDMESAETCRKCKGTGTVGKAKDPCPKCKGTGQFIKDASVQQIAYKNVYDR